MYNWLKIAQVLSDSRREAPDDERSIKQGEENATL